MIGKKGRPHVRAAFDLGKLGIVELWFGFFAGASLLGRHVLHEARAVAILGLLLVLGILVIAVTCALDDITGARDGVDEANHRAGRRWGVRKPILEGRLSEAQAFRLVRVAGAAGGAAYAGVLALAWPVPLWLVALTTALVLLPIHYSYGLALSYRGAGELVVFAGGFGSVLLPYALVTGTAPPALLFSAALVGAWHAQIVMFSNTVDAEGDRANGRMTIAARTTPRGNKIYITAVFLAVWGLSALALGAGRAPLLYGLALCPVWALQLHQWWTGVRDEQWLHARLLGFRVLRTGVIALTLANLLTG